MALIGQRVDMQQLAQLQFHLSSLSRDLTSLSQDLSMLMSQGFCAETPIVLGSFYDCAAPIMPQTQALQSSLEPSVVYPLVQASPVPSAPPMESVLKRPALALDPKSMADRYLNEDRPPAYNPAWVNAQLSTN
eukprot:COSAG01_NODE_21687_length_890_cov_1.039191_2_plen_133_part_00